MVCDGHSELMRSVRGCGRKLKEASSTIFVEGRRRSNATMFDPHGSDE